jgi:hypothetical protein
MATRPGPENYLATLALEPKYMHTNCVTVNCHVPIYPDLIGPPFSLAYTIQLAVRIIAVVLTPLSSVLVLYPTKTYTRNICYRLRIFDDDMLAINDL